MNQNKIIALVDHGAGNLRSVSKALEHAGANVRLTDDASQILNASKVVLPGVGAFGDCMAGLRSRGLEETILEVARRGVPLLGICVGMQMFFEVGEEMGSHPGLGLLQGRVRRFESQELKIPQTGWNMLWFPEPISPLFTGLPQGAFAYFNHSYYCDPAQKSDASAHTEYGIRYASSVWCDNLYGVQFHPEKSQAVGLKILRNFVERCE